LLRFLLPIGAKHLEEEENRRFFDVRVVHQNRDREKKP
jgi:hypothetical protein